MKRNFIAQFILLLVFTVGIAHAEKLQIFDDIDTDGDGYISKSESKSNMNIRNNWTAADTDKDGKIDISEFSAFEGKTTFQPPELEEPEPGAAPSM